MVFWFEMTPLCSNYRRGFIDDQHGSRDKIALLTSGYILDKVKPVRAKLIVGIQYGYPWSGGRVAQLIEPLVRTDISGWPPGQQLHQGAILPRNGLDKLR
jgi:hypothetical protein